MAGGVVLARVGFIALGTILAATIAYTCVTDGSPFRMELLTPWMKETLLDFYILVFIFGCWVWYKEDSVVSRIIWIVLLVCFGSVTAAYYVSIQLFKISVHDPIYTILYRRQRTSQHKMETNLS
ncbi:uncharacterized protein LOC9651975 isoform X1 [Selaginella moellendorffii]|uniref:uncharacterized protein LOC9651975 isoform X1 n=1 Tax=Selaginella moellendorffii TaxID=88036 RepID=UPI000D1C869D|nr:uncharacterized protein LOC9651975 isoform X1 [Selaginella moellendorffii]|eukprot:XP_002987953.2 uncharacterized protein LOC9651975 isoform X1 [Selaginella moellendorffii]